MLGGLARTRLPPAARTGRQARPFSHTPARPADFTHAIIGGGVVGLAVARTLARVPGTSTLLLERRTAVGTETSSRSSEVVHAGIFYGASSLKAALCIAGREQLYAFCAAHGVGHRKCGKWIVAQTGAQREVLEQTHALCTRELGVPVRWVGRAEAEEREPEVRARAGVLESPETGIVDSHGLMVALRGLLEESGGTVALDSAVVGVRALGGEEGRGKGKDSGGWEVTVREGRTGEEASFVAETVVNAAGLGAVDVHNMIVPEERRLEMFYAKGNYFSYAAARPKVSTLIYPAPEPGRGGLGTHLTLDLAGRIRFGPDVEWVDSADDLAVNSARLPEAVEEIKKYLPSADETALQPDYAGIRPKLGKAGAVMAGKGFVDFIIRKEEGYEGWVNLLGIESPGLTSSLAIADRVKGLLYN